MFASMMPNIWPQHLGEKWAMLLNSVNILLRSGCLHGAGDDQVILAEVGLLVWGLD